MLTTWLRTLCSDCNFKVRFRTLNKEYYAQEWEARNLSILPVKPPEFYAKNVLLGRMEKDLESMYVEVIIDNAGCRQPHEYILSNIRFTNNKYFLAFTSEFSNWAASRIVVFDEYNQIIRNDFKRIHALSWQDFKEKKYQPKKKKVLASEPVGKHSEKPLIVLYEDE